MASFRSGVAGCRAAAGCSRRRLALLLVFAASDQPLGVVANSEIVAVEIVRTLCGSIGLVAAVPITTLMAAVLVGTTTDGNNSETTSTDYTPQDSTLGWEDFGPADDL